MAVAVAVVAVLLTEVLRVVEAVLTLKTRLTLLQQELVLP
tara:strand:- start:513 stop:632 length:120 start_codon:yes stop_codon:yes gene_type:complete